MEAMKTFAMALNRSVLSKDIRRLIIGKCVVKKIEVTQEGNKTEWFEIFGEINGSYKWWYINGKLRCERMYKDGKYNGLCKSWYKNGNLEYESMYKDGKQNGLCKMWHENGLLMYEDMFKDGVLIN